MLHAGLDLSRRRLDYCCAAAVRDAVRRLGLDVRAGVHTGECELADGDLRGVAVHIAARICSSARPGEVLASSTVRDLVAGSDIRFGDRGLHELKGVPERWRLFTADEPGAPPDEPLRAGDQRVGVRAFHRLSRAVARRAPAVGRAAIRASTARRRRPP